jgi:hypothetical protein
MTDDLYERYKEALRVGHVAVLRGALEDALEAYRSAATIAPSRALPHTSLGGVLLRLGHLDEALNEYSEAVARAPHDEGALLGQAEALSLSGQRVDAAAALDHVSEIQEAAGRLPEAADTLRRSVDLDETAERVRRQRGLLRQIRLSAGDQAAEQLLARALRLRDDTPAPASPLSAALSALPKVSPSPAPAVPASATPPSSAPEPEPAPQQADRPEAVEPAVEPEAVSPEVVEPGPDLELAPEPALESAIESAPELEPVAAAPVESHAVPDWPKEEPTRAGGGALAGPVAQPNIAWPANDRIDSPAHKGGRSTPETTVESAALAREAAPDSETNAVPEAQALDAETEAVVGAVIATSAQPGSGPHHPGGDELLAAAEAAENSGDATTLRSLLLWTARAYAQEGRFAAGLDAAHRLLLRGPSDVDAHLALVDLYIARDWNALAADKLVLLSRLADLNSDQEARQRICSVAARSFPQDSRLSAICS